MIPTTPSLFIRLPSVLGARASGCVSWQLTSPCRVKLPKSFIAVNLSDAFTFEENENTENESDAPGPTESSTLRDEQPEAKGELGPEEGVPAGEVI